MPQPITGGAHAQHSCARNRPHTDTDDARELGPGHRTLDAKLREHYAGYTEEHPCELSVPELARMFAPGCSPKNGEREILRAHDRIRESHVDQFFEQPQYRGSMRVQTARWWTKYPGESGRSRLVRSSDVDLRIGTVDQTAEADRPRVARRRDSAPRSNRSQHRETKPAREVRVSPAPRRRAVPHGVTNPRLLEVAPVSLEGLAAVHARFPVAFDELADELRRERYHEHPLEACRAVRTLGVRDTDTPLRLLRHLMRQALEGDLLCDAPDDGAATVEAEQAARLAYAWDPDNPLTHWPDELHLDGEPRPPPRPPSAEQLEARRQARERRELERILHDEIVRTTPARPLEPSKGAAFLAALEERQRHREMCGPPD